MLLDRTGEILFRIAPHVAAVASGKNDEPIQTMRRMQALPQLCDAPT